MPARSQRGWIKGKSLWLHSRFLFVFVITVCCGFAGPLCLFCDSHPGNVLYIYCIYECLFCFVFIIGTIWPVGTHSVQNSHSWPLACFSDACLLAQVAHMTWSSERWETAPWCCCGRLRCTKGGAPSPAICWKWARATNRTTGPLWMKNWSPTHITRWAEM